MGLCTWLVVLETLALSATSAVGPDLHPVRQTQLSSSMAAGKIAVTMAVVNKPRLMIAPESSPGIPYGRSARQPTVQRECRRTMDRANCSAACEANVFLQEEHGNEQPVLMRRLCVMGRRTVATSG